MQKRLVRYTPVDGSTLNFTFEVPDSYQMINVEFFDRQQKSILLHVDIRFMKGILATNQRHGFQWKQEEHHAFQFIHHETHALTFCFAANAIQLTISNHLHRLDLAFSIETPDLINAVNYTHTTLLPIGYNPTPEGLLRLACLAGLPKDANRMNFRELMEKTERLIGLSCVVDATHHLVEVETFITYLYQKFNEIIILLSADTAQHIVDIRRIQARYFNVKYYICDYRYSTDSNVELRFSAKELYHFALAKTHYQNIFWWQAACPLALTEVATILHQYQVALRRDSFALWIPTPEHYVLLAFSAKDNVSFSEDATATSIVLDPLYLYKAHLEQIPPRLGEQQQTFATWVQENAAYLCHVPKTQLQTVDDLRLSYPQLELRRYKVLDDWTAPVLPKLLIMIITCAKNVDKANAQRATWLKTVQNANIDYCFVIGKLHHASHLADDILYVDAPDSYEFLGAKVQAALQYVVEHTNYDYVFKIDDDCILNLPALLRIQFEAFDYLGSAVNRGYGSVGDWHYRACSNQQLGEVIIHIDPQQTWYDGQGGYLLSRHAATLITQDPQQLQLSLLEDYGIGLILAGQGIRADYIVPEFQSRRVSHIAETKYGNFAVLSDIATAEHMLELWELLRRDTEFGAIRNEFFDTFYLPEPMKTN